MPHWRQEGATYFVTFRLADSIPAAVASAWAREREVWLHAWGITPDLAAIVREQRYLAIPRRERRAFERLHAKKLLVELDRCHGECEMRDPRAQEKMRDALLFFDGGQVHSGDFAILPNHVHWLVLPEPGAKLEVILKSIKQFTATEINPLTGRQGNLWQKESFDHIVRDREALDRTRSYIENNGRKAGLSAREWTYVRADWL